MSKIYRIDTSKKILYVSQKGVLNNETCSKCIKDVCTAPGYDNEMSKLIDLTEAESSSKLDVQKLHEAMMATECSPKSKLAIVTRHPITVAKAMLIIELRDENLKDSESKVFSEVDSAEFWLQN